MKKYTILFVLLFVFAVTTAYGQSELLGEAANQDFSEKIQPQLLEQAADAETTPFDFMLITKRLGIYGDSTAAPILAKWLSDPNKSHSARNALEEMPFEEALIELRNAVSSIKDPLLKSGVIESLGMRRDRKSVDIIFPLLNDADETIAETAFFALARIAEPSYREALMDKWSDNNEKNCITADLLLMYGDFLRRDGNETDAITVFKNVSEKAPTDFYKEAACYQILLRETEEARNLAAEWITGSDETPWRAVLRAAQFVKSDGVTGILIDAYNKVSDERKPALLAAIGDQKNIAAQEILLVALSSDNDVIRTAAIDALRTFSDPETMLRLIDAALAGDEKLVEKTIAVIEYFDESVDPIILTLLDGDSSHQKIGAALVASHKIIEGRPKLLELAQNAQDDVKSVVYEALGFVADHDVLSFLTDVYVQTDSNAALSGIYAACGTVTDKKSAADILAKAADTLIGKKDQRSAIFKALAILGGVQAREIVEKAAFTNDIESCDLATQTLGNWMTPDVAPILLRLANTPGYPYANRALRGALRLAKQFAMPDWFRRYIVRDVLASPACGDREKELADVIIRQYGLDMSIPETNGQKLLRNVEIVSAYYGVPDNQSQFVDVTDQVYEAFFKADSETFGFDKSYNDVFGGDPAPNIRKQLRLTIRYRDTKSKKTFDTVENAKVTIPFE